MRRIKNIGTLAILLFFICSLIGVGAAPAGNAPVRKIVVFQNDLLSTPARDALVRRFGGTTVKHLPLVNGMAVLLPPGAEAAFVARAEVLRIDDDLIMHALPKPVRPGKPDKDPPPPPQPDQEPLPWGIEQIGAVAAWDITRGPGIGVAILDSGIDTDHPDLEANIRGGVNTINPRKSYEDDLGHGTHVAGTIAAVDDEFGVVGVAPNAHLFAVKVLNRRGIGFLSDIIEGLQWTIDNKDIGDNNIRVINMSLGGGGNLSYHDAIIRTYEAGITIVAAAGNDGLPDSVNYPAAYPETIAVSATDKKNELADWSSRGPEVDLAAPGVNIPSTWLGGGYHDGNGTSMATPHVAGTAALVIATWSDTNPGVVMNPDVVKAWLKAKACPLGDPDLYGAGLVDAEAAVNP